MADADNFETLTGLIREVKPTLSDAEIKPGDFLIDTLGLDSLDLVQLARAVRKKINRDFDQDEWLEGAAQHRCSVNSLLQAASAPSGAG